VLLELIKVYLVSSTSKLKLTHGALLACGGC